MGEIELGVIGTSFADGATTAPALEADGRTITHGELRRLIEARRDELRRCLPPRSVVLVVATASVEFVVTYLALLADRHVPLLAGDQHERLVERWRPAAVVTTSPDGWHLELASGGPGGRGDGVELHPDLALLLSTSGSSGSPKLVRLSWTNLWSNATSIVSYLELTERDVGITTLPLHYCYGLSVLHSHLLAGASVVLTESSVVDDEFAILMRRHGVTDVAGVPHTFELLDRRPVDALFTPSLRFVTQAGGRMEPERVRSWAQRCDQRDVSMFVMYGQTEATARMSYVPPHLVHDHSHTIGVPIPGGALEVRGSDDGGVERVCADGETGELVYRGPNVMMGYADEPEDLALGAVLDELRTGDLGRRLPNGLFEVVGRRSRFVKPFGLRIDLDDLERRIRDDPAAGLLDGIVIAGDDTGVVVGAIVEGLDPTVDVLAAVGAPGLAEVTARLTSLPRSSIDVAVLDAVPRTDRGKVDPAAVLHMARTAAVDGRVRTLQAVRRARTGAPMTGPDPSHPSLRRLHELDRPGEVDGHLSPDLRRARGVVTADQVADLYAAVLRVPAVAPSDTFVSLGGDSLSYVECSIRLEGLLGELPADWHERPISSFGGQRRRTWHRSVDTTVVLRAIAILTVVSGHMILTPSLGGAHLMLAVAGYNVSRFLLDIEPARRRWSSAIRSISRIALPAMAWMVLAFVSFREYSWPSILLVNDLIGTSEHVDESWHYWFIEVLIQLTLLTVAGLSIPFVRRWERRRPFGFVLALAVAAMAFRFDALQVGGWFNTIHRPHGTAMVFLLGIAVHRSRTTATRLAVTAAIVVGMLGYFDARVRDLAVIGGLVLLTWRRELRLHRVIVPVLAVLATSSLAIYLTHYSTYPVFERALPSWPAFVATVASGVVAWSIISWLADQLGVLRQRRRGDPVPGDEFRSRSTPSSPVG